MLKKELSTHFKSFIAYLVIGLFILMSSLWLWVFEDSTLLNYGYADLNSFFGFAPYLFLFLIPALCMRSFSEEYRTGTIELLFSKPIKTSNIIFSKFWAAIIVMLLALLLSTVFVFSVSKLGSPEGNLDLAATIGSYFGLFLLGSCFVAISIFASSLTNKQVIAFLLALLLCYFFYEGISQVSSFFRGSTQHFIEYLGLNYHYNSLGKGLIKTQNIVYLGSLIGLFLGATYIQINNKKS